MKTGYFIGGRDILEEYESFSLEEQEQCGVTDNIMTDGSGAFRLNGVDLRTAIGRTLATGDVSPQYEFLRNGQHTSYATKGRRPIGVPVATLGVGTWYISARYVDGEYQRWIQKYESTTGETIDYLRIPRDPEELYAEIVGGGGGGAGSGLTYCSGGGGAGGWLLVKLPYLQYTRKYTIEVGAGGNGGGDGEDGQKGEDSRVFSNDYAAYAYGGNGGIADSGSQASGGGAYNDERYGFDAFVGKNGGNGGGKESSGQGISAFSFALPEKPEQTQWTRGGTSGGATSGNNYGGGGGASALANGAPGNSRKDGVAGTLGAGGSGAGYTAFNESSGGKGGDGVCYIYY